MYKFLFLIVTLILCLFLYVPQLRKIKGRYLVFIYTLLLMADAVVVVKLVTETTVPVKSSVSTNTTYEIASDMNDDGTPLKQADANEDTFEVDEKNVEDYCKLVNIPYSGIKKLDLTTMKTGFRVFYQLNDSSLRLCVTHGYNDMISVEKAGSVYSNDNAGILYNGNDMSKVDVSYVEEQLKEAGANGIGTVVATDADTTTVSINGTPVPYVCKNKK